MKFNRRRLLQGAAVTVLVAMQPELANSWTHGVAITGFNGGRSQVNLNAVQTGGDFVFLNQMLNAGYSSLGDNAGSPAPTDLDANGYPLPGSDAMVNHSGVKWVGFISDSVSPIYAIQITGKGQVFGIGTVQTIAISAISGGSTTATINFGTTHNFTVGMECPVSGVTGTIAATLNGNKFVVASISITSITITVAGTSGLSGTGGTAAYGDLICGVATGGRVIANLSGAPQEGGYQVTYWVLSTDATIPISKIAVVSLGSEETRYNSGETFAADFLAKLAQAKFGVIRHLNTLNTNASNTVFWADRCPTTYASYGGTRYKSSIYTTLSGSGNDYTGTIGASSLTYGLQAHVKFPAQQITSVSNGANAVITTPTAHGLVAGDVFNLLGDHASTAPTGALFYTPGGPTINYYVLATGLTTTAFQFSTTPGGTAVTTSSSGSGTMYIHKTVVDTNVTFSGSTVTLASPQVLSVGDPLGFETRGGALPTNINGQGGIYYVKTAASTTSITIAATPGGAAITFTGTPSGTNSMCRLPTLNLDGLGAKPIVQSNGSVLSVAGNSIPRARTFGNSLCYGTVTYDTVVGAWMLFGSTDGWSTQGIGTSEWPPELTLALSIKTGAHPWLPAPAYTMDPITDYMPSFAKYYKDNKPAWMLPRFENINEEWNGQFMGSYLHLVHGACYFFNGTWTSASFHEVAGKSTSVLGQALAVVFGSVGNGYEAGVGVQTGTMTDASAASNSDPRLTAAQYVAQTAAVQSPMTGSWGTITFTKSAAYSWATFVCPANYINPGEYNTATETTRATNFAGVRMLGASISGTTLNEGTVQFGTLAIGMTIFGRGVPNDSVTITGGSSPNWTLSANLGTISSRSLWAGNWSHVQLYNDSYGGVATGFNLASTANLDAVTATWAKQVGFKDSTGATKKVFCYEGGLSPDFTNGGQYFNSQVNILRWASLFVSSSTSFAQGAQTVLAQNYANVTTGGALFPSCFMLSGPIPVSGIWSVLVDIYDPISRPQWNAIVGYNA